MPSYLERCLAGQQPMFRPVSDFLSNRESEKLPTVNFSSVVVIRFATQTGTKIDATPDSLT